MRLVLTAAVVLEREKEQATSPSRQPPPAGNLPQQATFPSNCQNQLLLCLHVRRSRRAIYACLLSVHTLTGVIMPPPPTPPTHTLKATRLLLPDFAGAVCSVYDRNAHARGVPLGFMLFIR
jgi:hypothetical protein